MALRRAEVTQSKKHGKLDCTIVVNVALQFMEFKVIATRGNSRMSGFNQKLVKLMLNECTCMMQCVPGLLSEGLGMRLAMFGAISHAQ